MDNKKLRIAIKKIINEFTSTDDKIKSEIRKFINYFERFTDGDIQQFAEENNITTERVVEIYNTILEEIKKENQENFISSVKDAILIARKELKYGSDLQWNQFKQVWDDEGYSDYLDYVSDLDLKKEFEKQTTDSTQTKLF